MTPTPAPELVGVADSWFASDGSATIAAAFIGAAVIVIGYFIQQGFVRREHRAQTYSEAVRAVEDYMEAPFLIRRRDGTLLAQRQITNHISDIQSRIAYYKAQLHIYAARDIATAYDAVVQAARREAGTAMTGAWLAKPTRQGRQVPLGTRYSRAETDDALVKLTELMRRDAYRS